MRCRPGDLAVVTGPGVVTPGLLGRFVIVERQELPGDVVGPGLRAQSHNGEVGWMCRPAVASGTLPVLVSSFDGVLQVKRRVITDSILRPIRPNGGEGESQSWAKLRVEELA